MKGLVHSLTRWKLFTMPADMHFDGFASRVPSCDPEILARDCPTSRSFACDRPANGPCQSFFDSVTRPAQCAVIVATGSAPTALFAPR